MPGLPKSTDLSNAYSKAVKEWKRVIKETIVPPPSPPTLPEYTMGSGSVPKFVLDSVPKHVTAPTTRRS